ncbi:MAG: FAD-dependent oxidoreductase [Elusimicrobia bacterium]|nr:FAD-dependent oxidoreductase [Elusimicrobiota bacterium]
MSLGTKERPLRVAVVGSGPSGFYAAEALIRDPNLTVQVDMYDRLPTPYGLVRGGVAPDHQKIKSVILVYEKVALTPGFRFFGNVKLGKDIQIEDLKRFYDQIVYAVGNESDRKLGVPGEDSAGSYSATSFVGWYNGHPDWRRMEFNLDQVERVAVVGVGNVAMDVTRILAEDPKHLEPTDIADYALAELRKSKVKEIYLLGRRGPAQAAFSPAEIQEIGGLESADLVINAQDIELDETSREDLADPKNKKNVDYLNEVVKRGRGARAKKVRLRFLASPVEVIATAGRVSALKIEKNKLVKDEKGRVACRGIGQFETLPVGLVLRSVGYRGIPIAGVPFDEKAGKILNDQGRVLDPASKTPRFGEYVVGWSKRGPSGLIGTNRADSVATVNLMKEDLKANKVLSGNKENFETVPDLLKKKNIRFVTFQDWKQLDQAETGRGKTRGKIREKFTAIDDMLAVLNGVAKAVPTT